MRSEPVDDPMRVSHAFANVAGLLDVRLDGSGAMVRTRHDWLSNLAGNAGLDDPSTATRAVSFDVFVSYPREEFGVAETLVDELREAGLDVFYDQDIPSGAHVHDALYSARERSRAFVVIVSKMTDERRSQGDEIRHIERLADENGAVVVPLFTEGAAPSRAPAGLQRRLGIFLDEAGSIHRAVQQLVRSLSVESRAKS